MRRRSRTRRILKWVGLAMSGVVVLAWVISRATSIMVDPTKSLRVAIYGGGVRYAIWRPGRTDDLVGVVWIQTPPKAEKQGWYLCEVYGAEATRWLPSVGVSDPALRGTIVHTAYIPFWMLLALVGLPTAILWYRDRRWPKGRCQSCGYDLTGNVSGICPECGEPI